MSKVILVLMIAFGLLIPGVWWGSGQFQSSNAIADPSNTLRPLPVNVLEIQRVSQYASQRYYSGRIVPRRSSVIGFEVSGKVIEFNVDDGDLVEEQQTLARVDTRRLDNQKHQLEAQRKQSKALLQELEEGSRDEDIAAAQARVNNLKSRLNRLELQLKRRTNLFERDVITEDQYEEVLFGVESTKESLNVANQELAKLIRGPRAEQIAAQKAIVESLDKSIARVDIDLSDSVLKSPYSGTIAQRYVDEGTVVSSGQPVFELMETTHLEVRVGVPVDVASGIQSGDEFFVSVQRKTFKAKTRNLMPGLNSETRTRTVVLEIPEEVTETIVPDELARVVFTETKPVSGFWIPTSALNQTGRGLWSCFAIVEKGNDTIAELRLVEVLLTEEDRVLVRGTLNDGDQIVLNGAHRIVAGQRISPTPAESVDVRSAGKAVLR